MSKNLQIFSGYSRSSDKIEIVFGDGTPEQYMFLWKLEITQSQQKQKIMMKKALLKLIIQSKYMMLIKTL